MLEPGPECAALGNSVLLQAKTKFVYGHIFGTGFKQGNTCGPFSTAMLQDPHGFQKTEKLMASLAIGMSFAQEIPAAEVVPAT